MKLGIDISNFTSPLTDAQERYVRDNFQFVIIGIQNADRARAFQQQLMGMELEYYLDRTMRDWTVFHPGARVWIDIEEGCYTKVSDVDFDVKLLKDNGFIPGIYCNATSLKVLDKAPNPAWAGLALWYANYPADGHVPQVTEFEPFNGWTAPAIWQYSNKGVAGINCDLNVSFEEPPPLPYVTHITQHFSDGSVWELDVVPPPGR